MKKLKALSTTSAVAVALGAVVAGTGAGIPAALAETNPVHIVWAAPPIGSTLAPNQALIKAFNESHPGIRVTLQSQSTSNPNSITQAAAVAALTGTQEPVGVMAREFARRRNYVVERLRAIPGVSCTLPEGAFYVFPRVSAYFGTKWQDKTITSAMDLSLYLLQEAKVAVVAGEGFGSAEHIRISYATSMSNLEQGLDHIEAALRRLGRPSLRA
ncbi:MAG: aminotransferase class I/II-fold pyridoxal phosphate-dependent enzyme [Alicyclobacillus sp.]|nr:aminotransferase class I/II-fold pyridoxal phosphate-dependent enzyme [Alicyclobacillus sp.]